MAENVLEILRTRVLRGLHAGTLTPGDRLPSARELVTEFGVDHRLILAAYRQLAVDGLVEVRERGGIYVAGTPERGTLVSLSVKWLADTLTEGFARELASIDVVEWLRRATETARLSAIVISSTDDQAAGLARELRDDFGLEAQGFTPAELAQLTPRASALRKTDVVMATTGHLEAGASLARSLDKPFLSLDVRPDLVVGEWAMLLRQPVWAVVATPEFAAMLRRFFGDVRGIENLHILVYGRDDLSTVPEGAPTYVTHRVRESLGPDSGLRGRLLPPARTISIEAAGRIYEFIVRSNLRAYGALKASYESNGSAGG